MNDQPLGAPKENTTYDCEKDGHVFGGFFPADKFTKRRVCQIPWCSFIHTIDVRKVPS